MWQDLRDVRPSQPRRHAPLHGKSHPESPSKTAGPYSISLTHLFLLTIICGHGKSNFLSLRLVLANELQVHIDCGVKGISTDANCREVLMDTESAEKLPKELRLVHDFLVEIRSASNHRPSGDSEARIIDDLYVRSHSPFSAFLLTSRDAKLNRDNIVSCFLFPMDVIAPFVLELSSSDILRTNYLDYLAKRVLTACRITGRELQTIETTASVTSDTPASLHRYDRLARFETAGISFGEPEYYRYHDLPKIIENNSSLFYVYKLCTPQKRVFYIGKGKRTRLMQHEKELLKKKFPIHTNWKKLNKIAQILVSNKSLLYRIDSWHQNEESALLREEELILIYERENRWMLTNSDGCRWKGKASKKLNAWRLRNGVPEI